MTREVELSFTALRRAGAETIEKVRHHKERVIITNYGRPVAAIISIEDLELLRNAKKAKS